MRVFHFKRDADLYIDDVVTVAGAIVANDLNEAIHVLAAHCNLPPRQVVAEYTWLPNEDLLVEAYAKQKSRVVSHLLVDARLPFWREPTHPDVTTLQ